MRLASNSHKTAGSGPLQPIPVSGHVTNEQAYAYSYLCPSSPVYMGGKTQSLVSCRADFSSIFIISCAE